MYCRVLTNFVIFLILACCESTGDIFSAKLPYDEYAKYSLKEYEPTPIELKSNKPGLYCRRNESTAHWYPKDSLVFCIGLHKTGTETYASLLSMLLSKNVKSYAMHSTYWYNEFVGIPTPDDRPAHINKTSAYSDGGGHYWSEPDRYEFGTYAAVDVRFLHICYPKSLYILNVRPLLGWLISKMRFLGRLTEGQSRYCKRGGTEVNYENNIPPGALAWSWIVYREFYHKRVINLAMEDPSFATRFIITDIITDGEPKTRCILESFYFEKNNMSIDDNHPHYGRIFQYCSKIEKPTYETQANKITSTHGCFSKMFENEFEKRGYNVSQVKDQPLLVEPAVEGEVEQWLMKNGFGRFLLFRNDDYYSVTQSSSNGRTSMTNTDLNQRLMNNLMEEIRRLKLNNEQLLTRLQQQSLVLKRRCTNANA
jgi:hypothetical protein